MKPVISVENLTKRYGEFTAVDNISFEVNQGEVFGLLGPNGAGKTTTLEIIETLKTQTSGLVYVDGLDTLSRRNNVKAKIGIQLQAASFYPRLTLLELLGMFAAMYETTVDAHAMLRRFNLQEKANVEFDKLSGGQKQRFSIATTLVNNPKVIFLDEPTTGLDPQARINLWELVEEVRKDGVTIMVTTHYMDEAEQLCDRLVIMDGGKIIQRGSPKELIDNLLSSGYQPHKEVRPATLEDVFLNLTGKSIREA